MYLANVRLCFSKKILNKNQYLVVKYSDAQFKRLISTSSIAYGKRNFRKFLCYDRGTPVDHQWFKDNPEAVDLRGMRLPGYWKNKKLVEVPEMIPELVVPDLTNFKLKPYVSYRTQEVVQEKFTAEHLFYAVYSRKIKKDFEEGKLDDEGNPLEPSKAEKLTAEEAWQNARKTGSDLFG